MQRSPGDIFSGLIDLWVRADVEKCFTDNCDDRRIRDVQLLRRASVKREPRSRPTKNHVANLTPLRFAGTSTTTIPGLLPVAS